MGEVSLKFAAGWNREMVMELAKYRECIEEWQRIAREEEDDDMRNTAKFYLELAFECEPGTEG